AIYIPGFIGAANMLYIVVEASIIGILAIGMTFLLLIGLFDMSTGMQVSLCALVSVLTINLGILPCILIALATGLLVGIFNGLVTTKLNVNAFITTFASMGILKGITLVISNGQSIAVTNTDFNLLYNAGILGIPCPVFVFLVLAVLAQLFLRYTKTGFEIFVCGGNKDMAKLSGVNTSKITQLCFLVMSLCCGIVAVLMASRVNGASPTLGEDYTLYVITACVIGGVGFSGGGSGNIVNTFLGVLAMQIINNIMYMTNTYGFIQSLINGMVLLVVLGIAKFSEHLSHVSMNKKELRI
ncbi:MAG: ABC transporter permease, partial [Eubacteriales bacterium]|nr:ABC transporter permease [Eubacteriales bacterium]